MSNAANAITYVIQNEAGKSDRKIDLGGTTNFGITQKLLTQIKTDPKTQEKWAALPDSVNDLEMGQAAQIIHEVFWVPLRLEEIHSALIATCILDIAVNTGPHEAGTCAQLALGYVVTDGILGTKTIASLNDVQDLDKWLYEFWLHLAAYYFGIVSMNSSQLGNLRGWIDRSYRMVLLLEPV